METTALCENCINFRKNYPVLGKIQPLFCMQSKSKLISLVMKCSYYSRMITAKKRIRYDEE